MKNTLVSLIARERDCMDRIKAHDDQAVAERKRLIAALTDVRHQIGNAKGGLDNDRIAIARGILKIQGSYLNGGQDKGSVIRDAVDWLATGKSAAYQGLDQSDYGTKSYDRWFGQRSDHEWGGPRHGSIIFQIGLKDRKRELTEEERDAAIYFLLNIEGWETARNQAKAA
ncbi:MAG: hypothetical protein IPO08_19680 [Xanthomonadales bacterium]|nr:hypothetical protein [Xanthomonadales bacterium]